MVNTRVFPRKGIEFILKHWGLNLASSAREQIWYFPNCSSFSIILHHARRTTYSLFTYLPNRSGYKRLRLNKIAKDRDKTRWKIIRQGNDDEAPKEILSVLYPLLLVDSIKLLGKLYGTWYVNTKGRIDMIVSVHPPSQPASQLSQGNSTTRFILVVDLFLGSRLFHRRRQFRGVL